MSEYFARSTKETYGYRGETSTLGVQNYGPETARTRWSWRENLPLIGALAFTILGFALRIHQLEINSYWIDEMFHVNAAKSILLDGTPDLEGGKMYTRAIPFTGIVAFFFRLFGESETVARMPSVLAGTALIFAAYWTTKKWFGAAAGVAATVLVAFSPLCLKPSRECRMYAIVQLLVVWLAGLTYDFIEKNFQGRRREQAALAAAIAGIFILSAWLQVLTILFVPAVVAYFFLMGCFKRDETSDGKPSYFSSRYSKAFIALAGGVTLILWAVPQVMEKISILAMDLPPWAVTHNYFTYYKWMIQDLYPVLFFVYPAAILFACIKDLRKGLYVGALFTVPFLICSLLLQWKEERYMAPFFTFFLLGLAPLAGASAKWIWRTLQVAMKSDSFRLPTTLRKAFAPALLLAVVPLFNPWTEKSIDFVNSSMRPAWREAAKRFSLVVTDADVVVTTHPLEMKHYGMQGKMFKLNNHHLKQTRRREGMFPLTDAYTGVPLITGREDLDKLFARYPENDFWFLMNAFEFADASSVPASIRDYLIQNADWFDEKGKWRSFAMPQKLDKGHILIARVAGGKRHGIAQD